MFFLIITGPACYSLYIRSNSTVLMSRVFGRNTREHNWNSALTQTIYPRRLSSKVHKTWPPRTADSSPNLDSLVLVLNAVDFSFRVTTVQPLMPMKLHLD